MSSDENSPRRQFVAAWEATAAVVSEWAERTATATSEAIHKLATDPAIRAVLDSWRISPIWARRDCECSCATSHPEDVGICDSVAVIKRHLITDQDVEVDVPLCAPCAVAQGVAELPRLSARTPSLSDRELAADPDPGPDSKLCYA